MRSYFQVEMERPVVYVSAACSHSRNLLDLMERTGFAGSYSFVNVDTERRLPKFVDRVPLLYDGNAVVTDEALFDMFSMSSTAAAQPDTHDGRIEAADMLCGSAFETAYDVVATGDAEVATRDSCWRLDEPHAKIVTPECQPMPDRDQKKAS